MEEAAKFKRLRKNRNLLVLFLLVEMAICTFLFSYMLADPSGKIFNLEIFFDYVKVYFSSLFTNGDYRSGFGILSLFIMFIGLICSASVILLLIRRYFEYAGYVVSIISGVLLIFIGVMFFLIFPVIVVPLIFWLIGLMIIIISFYGFSLKNESLFFFNESKFTISEVSDTLTVYFSNNGSSKKLAYELASRNGSEIFEMVPIAFSNEKINEDRMYRKYSKKSYGMVFDTQNAKIFENYKKVIVVAPISWGHLSPPARYFFREYGRKISPNLEVYLLGGLTIELESIIIEIKALTELPDFKVFKCSSIRGSHGKPRLYKHN